LPVTMRSAPSFTTSGNFGLTNSSLGGISVSSFALDQASVNTVTFNATVASGLVAGNATQLYTNNSLASKFIVSAEL
jgi:hypothetical protein